MTGLSLAALLLGLLYLGPAPFFGLALVVLVIAQAEFYLAAHRAGYRPATALGLVAGIVLLVGIYVRGEAAAGLVIFLTLLFTFLWYAALEPGRGRMGDIAVTMLGVLYIPLLGSFAGLVARRWGTGAATAMIGAAAVYDVIAYAAGSNLGRRQMAPAISPKKTVEGAAVASVGLLVAGSPLIALLGPWNYPQAAVFALLVCAAAPLGDLVESMVKRDLAVKDMGVVFPGHGGALDRIDAILFTAPAAYLSLRIFGL